MDEIVAQQWYALFNGIETVLTIVGAVYAALFIVMIVAFFLLESREDKTKKEKLP